MSYPEDKGIAAIGLFAPKNVLNVGSVLRAAGCFGAKLVAVEGERYRRCATDTAEQYRRIPVLNGELHSLIPFDCVPVAIDLLPEAQSLHAYTHPKRAFYIFGPEDGTLGNRITSWCRDVVYIPSRGCLNLAAAVNIVLYSRQLQQRRTDALMDASRLPHGTRRPA